MSMIVVNHESSKDEITSLMYSQMSYDYINLTDEQIADIGVILSKLYLMKI